MSTTPNLPMVRSLTRPAPVLTFDTASWTFDFASLWAARGDALIDSGVSRDELSAVDLAAQFCVRFYLDEMIRLCP